jgi:hypothetical protein
MSKDFKILLSLSVLSATLHVATVSTLRASNSPTAFEGVWKTVEVVVPGSTPQTFRPVATLAIFHGKHYSRVEVHVENARPVLKDPAMASADELRAVWGPFVAEAGTFDVTDNNVITMRAIVAKNPAAMTNGATSVYTFRRDGDTLTLTQTRTPFTSNAVPVRIKLMRVE